MAPQPGSAKPPVLHLPHLWVGGESDSLLVTDRKGRRPVPIYARNGSSQAEKPLRAAPHLHCADSWPVVFSSTNARSIGAPGS